MDSSTGHLLHIAKNRNQWNWLTDIACQISSPISLPIPEFSFHINATGDGKDDMKTAVFKLPFVRVIFIIFFLYVCVGVWIFVSPVSFFFISLALLLSLYLCSLCLASLKRCPSAWSTIQYTSFSLDRPSRRLYSAYIKFQTSSHQNKQLQRCKIVSFHHIKITRKENRWFFVCFVDIFLVYIFLPIQIVFSFCMYSILRICSCVYNVLYKYCEKQWQNIAFFFQFLFMVVCINYFYPKSNIFYALSLTISLTLSLSL